MFSIVIMKSVDQDSSALAYMVSLQFVDTFRRNLKIMPTVDPF